MCFILPARRVQKDPGPVSLKNQTRSALTTVLRAAMPYLKAIPSLKAAVAGQVFMTLSVKAASSILLTMPTACKELRYNAAAVKAISAMCLMTGRHPLVSATALTALYLILRRLKRQRRFTMKKKSSSILCFR